MEFIRTEPGYSSYRISGLTLIWICFFRIQYHPEMKYKPVTGFSILYAMKPGEIYPARNRIIQLWDIRHNPS